MRHTFQPELFFLGRTEGSGVVRTPTGRIIRRYHMVTEGRRHTAYNSLHLRETLAFSDGEVDIWRWALTGAGHNRYIAAEAKSGCGLVIKRRGEDYEMSLTRPWRHLRGPVAPRFQIRLTVVSPELATRNIKIRLFGAPIAEMSVVHRKIAA